MIGASVQMAGHRGKVVMAVVSSFSAAVVVAGCGPMLTASAGTGDNRSQAVINVTPALKSNAASVLAPIVVKADLGTLTSVAVTGPDGQLPGTMSADGATWTSQPGLELPFDTKYEVTAVAIDPEGRAREVNDTFTTVKPAATPVPGTRYTTDYVTYGVGMPLVIPFKSAVTNKAEVESKLKLTTSQPVEGAWSWSDDSTIATFRPKDFWPVNTHVNLDGHLYGTKLNDTDYAGGNVTLDLDIGDKVTMVVDPNSLQMTVSRNDQPEKVIPVTIGKPGYETYEGIKVISAKEGTITMKSPPGDPEYYVADKVEYSIRLTDHGEYLHAAPWASDAFGSYRYSHGCISMTTENAAWVFGASKPGDLVWVNGPTGEPWRKDNGITVWNETWPEWLSKSATGAKVVGPQGQISPAPAPAPSAPAPAAATSVPPATTPAAG